MNSPFFHVVDFLERGEVEVVSSRWMAGEDACYWPPYKFPNYVKRAQLQHEKPAADWETYKVRSLYKTSKSFIKCCYTFEVHSLFTNRNAVISQYFNDIEKIIIVSISTDKLDKLLIR